MNLSRKVGYSVNANALPALVDVPHWLDPGFPDVDTPHWLWAPEAIDTLPWADKLPEADAPLAIDEGRE